MKKTIAFGLLIALIGCGGSGISEPSKFEGVWNGTYSIPSNLQKGTVDITISRNGDVNGTGVNTTLGKSFTINGSINNSGSLEGEIGGSFTGTLKGNFALKLNGNLGGSVTQTVSGYSPVTSNFNLVKK